MNGMKRKKALAALAAAVLLSGCSEGGNSSGSTSVITVAKSASTARSAAAGASSSSASKGGAPTVIAPNFLGSSSAGQSVVPDTSSETKPTEYETSSETEPNGSVPAVSVDTSNNTPGSSSVLVGSGEVNCVEDLEIESSVEMIVEGTLHVRGTITINDDSILRIADGGVLIMDSDDACVDGSGSVAVSDSFLEQINCEVGTIKAHIIPPESVVENGATYVGGIVIANKAIKLPPEFGDHLSLNEVEPEVYEALAEMNANSDHEYVNKSGYRSYWDQKAIFQNYCDMYGYEEADTFSSQAGHSEHQTGLTMDLDDFEESYGATSEGIWLAENCWRYGFIIRYPKGKEDITGYTYEPWHVRYLGKSTAKLVYDSGLTLEEFLNVPGGTVVID